MDKKFLLALGLIFVVRGSFADQNYVPSGSMEPTIQVGDHVLVDKLAYDLHLPYMKTRVLYLGEPRRGEIIVFHSPENDMRLVKRLIAVPGDHVRIENGYVWVNDQAPLETPAVMAQPEIVVHDRIGTHAATLKRTRALFRPDYFDFVVPPGQYFAMGDNRDNSWDSRAWGFIPRANLEGRALGVIYNLAWALPPRVRLDRIAHPFD